MKKDDIKYLCELLGNLTGLPVRYFCDGTLEYYVLNVNFPKDPSILHEKELHAVDDPIGYYLTSDFLYYGILNIKKDRIIIGPAFEIPISKKAARSLAFSLNLTGQDIDSFEQSMQVLVPMPLQITLQILCALYFGITGEKKSLKDITIFDESQNAIREENIKIQTEQKEFGDASDFTRNSYTVEQTLMEFIRQGNVAGLTEWTSHIPSVRPGIMAKNQLRQTKNTFIVTVTLASRAAIDGGLSIDEALSLSDLYIQKCEALDTIDRITNLQFHMIMDFATLVQSLRFGDTPSTLVLKVANYVHQHISDHITTEDLAKELYLSRGYLSTAFKKETGMPLSNYIMSMKIEEAKRLLLATDKSLADIGSYLGFSSHSHFSSTFYKYENTTPSEYRKRRG